MATNFPASLDTFVNPLTSDKQGLSSPKHSVHHENHNDAIEALQAKVGIDSSAVVGSLDYRLSTLETNNTWTNTGDQDLSEYALLTEVPTDTIDLTNSAGFITATYSAMQFVLITDGLDRIVPSKHQAFQLPVDGIATEAPVSPIEGMRYIVNSGATGDFSGQTFKIATYTASGWIFEDIFASSIAYVTSEQKYYTLTETTGWQIINLGESDETDPVVGAVNGIVRSDGLGNISAALVDVDYQVPLIADGDYLTPNTAATTYQQILESGVNIKTVNSESLLGSGDILIEWGGGAVDWIEKTTTYTAVNGDGILADTSGSAWVLTLPVTPIEGDVVGVSDVWGTFATNNLTIARNGNLIMGEAEDLIVDINNASFLLVYTGVTTGWKIDTFLPYGEGDFTATSTTTLTNKRITPRVWTAASDATPDIDSDSYDAVTITALAAAITDVNVTGTPTNFQKLIFRIKDNGVARAITWGTDFEAKGVALPTTTVLSKVLTVGFIYDTVTAKWGCVASAQEE